MPPTRNNAVLPPEDRAVDDNCDLYDAHKLTAGGAANVLTVDAIPEGDAYRANNTQRYRFQVGVNIEIHDAHDTGVAVLAAGRNGCL